MLFQRPNRQNPSDVQKRLSLFKFACSHLHQHHFLCHSTAVNLNANEAPPSLNLLAAICTCAVFPTAPPPPTSIPIGHRPPQICLQTFAPAAFSPPLHLNQPQYRRGTATLKFACRHLHLCRFPLRFSSTNLNTDGVPPPPNLLADICTCAVFPTASPPPTSIPMGHRLPAFVCLMRFLFVGSVVCRRLPSAHASRRWPCHWLCAWRYLLHSGLAPIRTRSCRAH